MLSTSSANIYYPGMLGMVSPLCSETWPPALFSLLCEARCDTRFRIWLCECLLHRLPCSLTLSAGACFCRDEQAAAARAVHERLVFELFGIKESFRQKIYDRNAGRASKQSFSRPRSHEEATLYMTPLKCIHIFFCALSECRCHCGTLCILCA